MKIRIKFLDPGAIEIGAEDAHWNAPSDDEKTCAQINSAVNKFADEMGRMIVEIDTETMTARVLEVAEHENLYDESQTNLDGETAAKAESMGSMP